MECENFVLTLLLAFVALQLVNFGFCCTAPTMLLLCFGSGEETVGDLDLGESVSTSSSSSAWWETEKRRRHRCWAPFSEAGCLLQGIDLWLSGYSWPLTQTLPFQPSDRMWYKNTTDYFISQHVVAPFDDATHQPLKHSLLFLYPLLTADRSAYPTQRTHF